MARVVTDPPTISAPALVTGAGRDREIGTAVCRALAARGHAVAFTVPPGGDGGALAAELGAVALEADLADAGAAADLLDTATERLGGLPAVLVNNAAHSVNGGYQEMDGSSMATVSPDGSIRAKLGWWHGLDRRLIITGRRLDAKAPPLRAETGGDNGGRGFRASALIFPTVGCWRVVGRAGAARLTFVVHVVKIRKR